MALRVVTTSPAKQNSDKAKFENRLRLIGEKVAGIKSKALEARGYTAWRIFSDVIVVRAWKDKYTLHTNGDITHYEMKEVPYRDVKFECDDLQFIANILDVK